MIIKVSYSRTYNLGNFNSLRLEAGTEYAISEGPEHIPSNEDITNAFVNAFATVKAEVEAQRAKEVEK